MSFFFFRRIISPSKNSTTDNFFNNNNFRLLVESKYKQEREIDRSLLRLTRQNFTILFLFLDTRISLLILANPSRIPETKQT